MCIYIIYNIYIYIYIYIYTYIYKLDNRIYLYAIIYLNTVNVIVFVM